MIERDAYIESIEPWCKDSMAIASDTLLGALVTLRLSSSEVFQLLGPKPSRAGGDRLHSLESLLSIIGTRIEEWECNWLPSVAAGELHALRFLTANMPDNERGRELPRLPHTVLWHALAPPQSRGVLG